MADHPYRKLISVVAPTVAVALALGSLIANAVQSDPDAPGIALMIAGGVYLGVGAIAIVALSWTGLAALVRLSDESDLTPARLTRRRTLWFFALLPIVLWLALSADDEARLALLGALAVPVSLALSGLALAWSVQAQKRAGKECPDCRETVKERANVCRYCSFRWHEAGWKPLPRSDYATLAGLPLPVRSIVRWVLERQPVQKARVELAESLSPQHLRVLRRQIRLDNRLPIHVEVDGAALEVSSKDDHLKWQVTHAAEKAWGLREAQRILGVWTEPVKVPNEQLSGWQRRSYRYWEGEPQA